MHSRLNNNSAIHNIFPVITIINKYGTTTYQPKTKEEYEIHLREKDENQQKHADTVGLLAYSTIILTCVSAYTIYSFNQYLHI